MSLLFVTKSAGPNVEIKPLGCTTGVPCPLLPPWNAVRAEGERKNEERSRDGKKTDCQHIVQYLSGELHHSLSCLFLSLHLMSASGIQSPTVCQTVLNGSSLFVICLLFEFATSHLKQHPNLS